MKPKCPACGRQIRRIDVHAVDFSCPGCGERLRLQLASGGETFIAVLAGLVLSFVVAYLVGSHWLSAWLLGLILSFPMVCALGLLKGYCFPLRITRFYGAPPQRTSRQHTTHRGLGRFGEEIGIAGSASGSRSSETLRLLILNNFTVINVGTRTWGTKSRRASTRETPRYRPLLMVARYGWPIDRPCDLPAGRQGRPSPRGLFAPRDDDGGYGDLDRGFHLCPYLHDRCGAGT